MTFTKLSAISFAITALFTTNVYAQNDFHQSCNTNISAEIVFENNLLTVKSNKNESILFKSSGVVEVDGKLISLSSEQQQLAQRYYNEVEATIPIVVDITVEALNITNMALTEVFTGLLGESSEFPTKINTRLNGIADAIKSHVYQNPNSLTFNSEYLEEDLGFGSDLETEIETIKEELVSSMMGELMIAFGKAMLSGDSNFSDLEERMNNIGQDIDQKAKVLGKVLEEKSDDLCARIKTIDDTETELRSISALQNLNTIHYNKA